MDKIYHYCALDAFVQIIKHKDIRLCDLDKTNDYLEKKWGLSLVQNALVRELYKRNINMNSNKDYWYSEQAFNHIEEIKAEISKLLNHQILVACFSTGGDNLNQWRAYGQDGEGIAIGFDYKKMKSLIKGNHNVMMDKVIYNKKQQEQIIVQKMFEPAMHVMKGNFNNSAEVGYANFNDYFVKKFDRFCCSLDSSIENVFTLLKNPAFESEKEVRIVYNTGIYDGMTRQELIDCANRMYCFGPNNELVLGKIQFQAKDKKFIPYADLSFENCIKDGIIKDIIIGPKARVSQSDIYQMLCVYGYDEDIKIKVSNASYR